MLSRIREIFRRRRAILEDLFDRYVSYDVIRKIRFRRITRKHGVLQKFWMGENPVLPASPIEKAYFDNLGFPSRILNCLDDYRSVGQLRAGTHFLSTDPATGEIKNDVDVQFAVACMEHWPADGELIIELGSERRVLRDLRKQRWHDLRIRNHVDGALDGIQITSPVPIFTTMPRCVQRISKEALGEAPRHIIICILDSWASRYLSEPHPLKEGAFAAENIRRYFAQGFQAVNGISSAEWTLPSVSSIFTGMHAGRHKVSHPRKWVELDHARMTLSEYFQSKGYHGLFAASAPRLSPAFGLLRGFDRFFFHLPLYSAEKYSPSRWLNELLGHLDAHSASKTFSYLHFPDIHPIWDNPDETRFFQLGRRGSTSFNLKKVVREKTTRYNQPEQAKSLYLLRMAELDRILGTLFDYVEREFGDEALVVLTADHGLKMPYIPENYAIDEPFMTDIRVEIPLFMRGSGIESRVYEQVCQPNIDLPKTLLSLAGIQPRDLGFDGVDLLQPHTPREFVLSESFFKNVYELAVRGLNHVLFLKFPADDTACTIKSPEPHYVALFEKSTPSYSLDRSLVEQEPEIYRRLHAHAMKHIDTLGLMRLP